jgi:hypothetical protein
MAEKEWCRIIFEMYEEDDKLIMEVKITGEHCDKINLGSFAKKD